MTGEVHGDAFHEEHYGSQLDLSLWRKLWRYTRPYRRQVAILMTAGAATALVDASFPLVTRRLIDDVVESGTSVGWLGYGRVYLALTTALSLSVCTFIYFAGRIRTHVSHDIRSAGFDNLQRLSFAYFDRRPVGWLMARMTSDCDRLTNILAWGALDLAWGLTSMGVVTVVLLVLDVRLALVTLAVIPLLVWVSLAFKRRMLETSRVIRRTNSRITAAYNEGIAGVRTAKTFTREAGNLADFRELSGTMRRGSIQNALLNALYLPIVLTLGSLATGLALALGGIEVSSGALSLGTLIAFLSYTRYFFDPVGDLAHWFAEMQMAQASAERVVGLIETEPAIVDSPAVRARVARAAEATRHGATDPELAEDGLPDRIGRIELRGVGFGYGDGRRVLEDFDLTVEPGETIALVGATGSGKSTLVNLLCRFYEPTEGRVLFDARDYRERSLHWLHSRLGIVLQTPHLFSGTLAENIRYGRLDATDAELEEAARLVGAHDFIAALERGYETEVGEGGVTLSMGEKQLVSFARAILAEPELFVLDEATSSVDTRTEKRIQEALEAVLAGRTSFVIAHRLSTIRSADRILVIDAGRIVEQGDHAALMARRGRYFDLYTQQSLRESQLASGDPASAIARELRPRTVG